MNDLPVNLEQIVQDFEECEGSEKLEFLLYFAERFPPLPVWLEGKKAEMDEVQECMTPVFIYASNNNGNLIYYLDVPEDSPTVRGFAAFLAEGVNNNPPEDVLRIPTDFYYRTGLQHVLSSQRLNGLIAILAHMKQLAAKHLEIGDSVD